MIIKKTPTGLIFFTLIIWMLLQGCSSQKTGRRANALPQEKIVTDGIYVREPAVAGRFYEGDPLKLRFEVQGYIDKAEKKEIPGKLIGLLAPHAGYIYSGPIAGYSYKQIEGKEYKTVIVMAPSHRVPFSGVSIIPDGFYRTPLGDVPVDSAIVKKIRAKDPSKIVFLPQAHENEHSLEVQVPFLQVALDKGWKIVPIVFGRQDIRTCSMIAEAIAPFYNPDEILIVASTDMSHYHPYDRAKEIDEKTIEYIENIDIEKLAEELGAGKSELCGSGPVVTLMLFTKALEGKVTLLKYANSGDTAGSKAEVVGYCSAVFSTEKNINAEINQETESGEEEGFTLDSTRFSVSPEDKKLLLGMARKTLEELVYRKNKPTFDYKNQILEESLGAFVTLRKKNGDLRGCIGHCFPIKKLRDALPDLTFSAAFQDPRFSPVRQNEVDDITIEISLLSPMRQIRDWNEIMIPGHGVYVRQGARSGVFLPQVADETGWDRDTFMEHLCVGKAGLPADAWKDPETEVYVFTVIKFEEN